MTTRAETEAALVERVRLAVALSTLQKHVFSFCQWWNGLQWDPSLTEKECRLVNEALSISAVSAKDAYEINDNQEFQALLSQRNPDPNGDLYACYCKRVENEDLTWWDVMRIEALAEYLYRREDGIATLTRMMMVEAWVDYLVDAGGDDFRLTDILAERTINEKKLKTEAENQRLEEEFEHSLWIMERDTSA